MDSFRYRPTPPVRAGRAKFQFYTVRQVGIAIAYQGGRLEKHCEGRVPYYSVYLDGQWYGPFLKTELIDFATDTL